MCKLYLRPWGGSKYELRAAHEHITGKPEDDGFGYVALDETTGETFSERWTDPDKAFKKMEKKSQLEELLFGDGFVEKSSADYDVRGKRMKDFKTFMAHGRLATNEVRIENTHPFQADTIWLVHNGMISQPTRDKYPAKAGTCDSESILKAYMAIDVANEWEGMQDLFDELTGSFACGVIAKTNAGIWIMDIFLNNTPTLWGGISKEGPVFCTNPIALQTAARCGRTYKLKGNTAIRFDITNKTIIDKKTLKEKSYVYTPKTDPDTKSFCSDYGYNHRSSAWTEEERDRWRRKKDEREREWEQAQDDFFNDNNEEDKKEEQEKTGRELVLINPHDWEDM